MFHNFTPMVHRFIGHNHKFQKAEANPEYMFSDNIAGVHYDKTWLTEARLCMASVIEADDVEMERFGGDTGYIRSLKELLSKYDPNISYWSNSRCTGEEFSNHVCANRRAYLMFFHDNVKFSGNRETKANYTPSNFVLQEPRSRMKKRNEKSLEEALGRATSAENSLMSSQFRNWLSAPEYEVYRPYKDCRSGREKNELREQIREVYDLKSDIYDMKAKPDFFSPVPPYPIKTVETSYRGDSNEGAPLGWTVGQGDVALSNPNALLKTELAHLVDSGEWKWIQYLVNSLEGDFLEITPEMDIIEIKNKLAEMNSTHKSTMYEADDSDPDYYVPDNFDEVERPEDLWSVSLYVLDTAANIVTLNARAHRMLFDNLMKSSGSPNMSANKKHSFFTLATTGQVYGVSAVAGDDGELMGYRKGNANEEGGYYPCGISNNSRVNSYWYDCSDDMFFSDKIQWLQNYRRKRWTQIRNICYAFLIEANIDTAIDMNTESNACVDESGCKYTRAQATNTWTSEYDEELTAYSKGLYSV